MLDASTRGESSPIMVNLQLNQFLGLVLIIA